MIDVLKKLIDVGGLFGVLLVAVILLVLIFSQATRTSQLDKDQSGQVANKLINTIILIFMVCFFGWFAIEAFKVFDSSNTNKHIIEVDKTEYIADNISLNKKKISVEVEQARQKQKEATLQKKQTHSDSIYAEYKKKGISMKQVDTVFVSSKNNSYSVKMTMKEGQIYSDLKTLLQIKVTEIDPVGRYINIQIENFEELTNGGKLLIKDDSKEMYFLEEGRKFYISFTNFQKSNGANLVNLNINQLL